MQQFIVTDNPILYVPNDWQDLGGNPANSPALVAYIESSTQNFTFVGSGGTQVFESTGTTANTLTIYSTPPTGTSVQFIDVLGNATDNVSLAGELSDLQDNIDAVSGATDNIDTEIDNINTALDGKSPTGHTHDYQGSTILNKPTLGSISEKDFWEGTQVEYDGLGSYDADTLYFITG